MCSRVTKRTVSQRRTAIRAALACAYFSAILSGCATGTDAVTTTRLNPDARDAVLLTPRSATLFTGQVDSDAGGEAVVFAHFADGTPAADVLVYFRADREGSVEHATVRTGSDGIARAGRWHLGKVAAAQQLRATTWNSSSEASFVVLAEHGAPAELRVIGAQRTFAATRAAVSDVLRVLLVDRFGNPVSGARVAFRVTAGGGALVDSAATTDFNGAAYAGAWTLGAAEGTQEVVASYGAIVATFRVRTCVCESLTLAYVRDNNIYTRRWTGDASRVTLGPGADAEPAWLPDGSSMSFTRWPGSGNSIASIYAVKSSGGDESLAFFGGVGTDGEIGGVSAPAWSPDGRAVAMTSGDAWYEGALLVASNDGSMRRSIANRATGAAWSPDSKRIAYVGLSGDDGYHTLRIVNVDGSENTELVSTNGGTIGRPTWSPDGLRIVFSRCSGAYCQLYRVNPDGTQLVQLTSLQNVGLNDAAWSPDGRFIAFTARDYKSPARVMVLTVTDGTVETLWEGSQPAWRPLAR